MTFIGDLRKGCPFVSETGTVGTGQVRWFRQNTCRIFVRQGRETYFYIILRKITPLEKRGREARVHVFETVEFNAPSFTDTRRGVEVLACMLLSDLKVGHTRGHTKK